MSAEDAVGRARVAFAARAPRVLAPLLDGGDRWGAALTFDLEVLRVPSGGWDDLAITAPGRLLDLPLVALHDLVPQSSSAREATEAQLLDVGALALACAFAAEAARDAEAGHDPASGLLLGALAAAATARLLDGDDEVLEASVRARSGARFAAAWADQAAALDAARGGPHAWSRGGDALAPELLARLGQRHAPLGAVFAHALEASGRPELVDVLAPAFAQVAGLHQLVCELMQVHRDLARGIWSLPVTRLAAAVGALPAGDAPPAASPVRLALVVTPAMPTLVRAALSAAEEVASRFARAGLSGVARLAGTIAVPLQAILDRFAGAPAAAPQDDAPVAFRVDARPRLEQALDALRAALDADPEGREAWLTRRSGAPEEVPSVDRVSGPALVLDNRLRAGGAGVAGAVDALLLRFAEAPEVVELDGLATLAHLARHAHDPAAARARLGAAIAERIAAPDAPRCAGLRARLALGLGQWPAAERAPNIDAAALVRAALADVVARGDAAFTAHDPLHGALLVLELVEALPAAPDADTARAWALAAAARHAGRAATSPLAAAWLSLIAATPAGHALADPHLRARLLRAQRAPGTWDAHPHLRDPARPGSRLIVTSFVYRALTAATAVRYDAAAP